jgi:hypothetical protein
MPQTAQERLVGAVAVIDGVEQLIAGQLAWIGECLLQLGLKCADLLLVGIGRPGPADEIVVGAVVGFGLQRVVATAISVADGSSGCRFR